jgi:hypothetical protein
MKVMKNLNHTFRRFVQKQMIYVFRYVSTEQEKSIYERDCIAVCKKFINQPDSIMLLTPISGKRYIRSEKNEIFIILDSHRVKIINHVYAYDVHINDKSWNQIISLFDNEVEKRREEFEFQITSNIKSSLQKIARENL